MANNIQIGYQEHTLKEVLEYFANGFKPAPGVTVVGHEAFVDAARDKVIFKISMRKDDPDRVIALQ